MPEPQRIDRRRAALIAYDVCRRALTPSDPARRATTRPVLDAWVQLIAAARAAGVPVIYTTPVSRDGADVVMLPTDLSAETGVPPLTNGIEGTPEAGFADEIAPLPEDYVFLKRRPSAFYGTGVAELLHMLRRDTIIIGGGATNRGVETSVREAFNMDLASVVERRRGRSRLQPRQGDEDVRAHPAPRPGGCNVAGMTGHHTICTRLHANSSRPADSSSSWLGLAQPSTSFL
jgi:maleamate amidohydrolase